MSAHQGVRVSSSTAVSPAPGFEHLSGGYEWRKVPGWTGGNIPEVREEAPAPFTAGSAAVRGLREARITRFGDALRDLGYPDPRRDIPTAAVLEAGKRVGVGEKTARRYRAALKRQRENCDGC